MAPTDVTEDVFADVRATATLPAMRAIPLTLAFALASFAALGGCNCGLEVLDTPRPHMKVSPQNVVLQGVPVAQDTRIVIQVTNDSIVNLKTLHAELVAETTDVAFRLEPDFPTEVLAGQTGEIVVVVRPVVLGTIQGQLVITGDGFDTPDIDVDDAAPSPRVVVSFTVEAIDAGLPDICDYPESVTFGLVGQNDAAVEDVRIKNCGIRDLLLDEVTFCATPLPGEVPDENGCGADTSIRVITVVAPGETALVPESSLSLELAFRPVDLEEHSGNLIIRSNDPDEPVVVIPVNGTGSACPTAVATLIGDPGGFEPFDTIRVTCTDSLAADSEEPGSFVGECEWRLVQAPTGSQAEPTPLTGPNMELEADLAGRYVIALDAFEVAAEGDDVARIKSCETATVTVDVVPTEELLIQLVWDHPSADFDLHLVRSGGEPFTHEDDVYFSNREPQQTEDEPLWSANPDENPVLDVDDDEGYGPENTNIVAPAPGSEWTVLVHYWNAQTNGGDARATATVRVFVFGQQSMEVSRTFEADEQLWHALDIEWADVEAAPPALSQLGILEPFPRPF